MADFSPKSSEAHSDFNSNTLSPYLNLNDPANPFRLDHGDSPALTLVANLLTTDNYATWSRSMRRALRMKNKLGFITGSLAQPTDPKDPLLELWERCNDMVVSWLQNSISPSLQSSVLFVDNAREIWLDLQERFSQQNGPRIYQLKKALAALLQEHDSVSIYYGKLKALWDELSVYDPIPICNCGTMKTLLDRYQRDSVVQFLMGLHDSYSPISDQIMLMDPIPPVSKVFSLVQQQERHHQMTSQTPSSETMAMAVKTPCTPSKFSPKPNHSFKKDRPYCSHCKITGHSLETCFKVGNAEPPLCSHCHLTGHTIEKCYKLNGYPPGHKYHNKKQQPSGFLANQTTLSFATDPEDNGDEKIGLTKQQYQQLIALLRPQDSPIAASAVSSSNPPQTSIHTASCSKMSGPAFMDNDWEG
ncbi:hypothetical protein F2P56_012604 [Juglans regia]|uniref:Retrotransposon Copia-like N-terminal domain-containing protein n=1 Tax=Juglans regia TaxID=51240 RepID=A0A833XML9_JUGRE|nr:hypothetical protein F2P56_012604 [Juglans regia]